MSGQGGGGTATYTFRIQCQHALQELKRMTVKTVRKQEATTQWLMLLVKQIWLASQDPKTLWQDSLNLEPKSITEESFYIAIGQLSTPVWIQKLHNHNM
jgi:hypothetical protein